MFDTSFATNKKIAAAIYGKPRLFLWFVARDFTGKFHQKRSMLQPLLQGPYVVLEPQRKTSSNRYVILLG